MSIVANKWVNMISVNQLKQAISDRVAAYTATDNPLSARQTMRIALDDACHHILATDITAHLDIPRQNLSAMDGFAFAHGSDLGDGSMHEIIGEVRRS